MDDALAFSLSRGRRHLDVTFSNLITQHLISSFGITARTQHTFNVRTANEAAAEVPVICHGPLPVLWSRLVPGILISFGDQFSPSVPKLLIVLRWLGITHEKDVARRIENGSIFGSNCWDCPICSFHCRLCKCVRLEQYSGGNGLQQEDPSNEMSEWGSLENLLKWNPGSRSTLSVSRCTDSTSIRFRNTQGHGSGALRGYHLLTTSPSGDFRTRLLSSTNVMDLLCGSRRTS